MLWGVPTTAIQIVLPLLPAYFKLNITLRHSYSYNSYYLIPPTPTLQKSLLYPPPPPPRSAF